MEDSILEKRILKLEKQLMTYEYEELDTLLTDDFMEFGSSGNTYDKKAQLEAVKNIVMPISTIHITITNFKIKLLSLDVVLATYRTLRHSDSKPVLRSSIWKLNEGKWQMMFHQGTPST